MATKILYVDDNKDTLFYIDFMLKRRGYEVATASSGKKALVKASENPPDIFLVDVLMPEMDGFELTQAIRAIPALAHLPIILFSAATTSEHKARGFDVGADDYLTKPILNDELDNRIQAALRLTGVRQKEEPVLIEPKKEPEKHQGRVIGFWGCKGGVGVTSMAVNTALVLAEKSQVILADLNVGMGSIVLQMGLQVSAVPRSPWTMQPDEINNVSVASALIPYNDNLKVLLMSEGERWSPTVPFVETVLDHLMQLADWVILDLGAGVTADKFPLLLCCHHIVLVSGSTRVASALAEYSVESANKLQIPRENISVVMIQRRDTTGMLAPEVLESQLRVRLDAIIPMAQADAMWAFEQGTPVVNALPDSQLAVSYVKFAENLADQVRKDWPLE
ncbi:MAG: response regulator [Anaerolineales bacterium]|nr:response regulator [Anaerolineales bacterium]